MTTDLPPPNDSERRPWRGRVALIAVVLLVIVAFYALGLQQSFSWEALRANLDAWREQARQHPVPSVLVFVGVYVAVTSLSLPVASWLSVLAGALFGLWLGTAVVSVASTLGATLAFLTSRYLFRDGVQRRLGPRLDAINRGVERDGAYYLFSLRLIPAVPFFLINVGMALTPMRVGTFVLVSWLGMLSGTTLYANVGANLSGVEKPTDILSWPVLGSLALLGLFPLAVRWLTRFKSQ